MPASGVPLPSSRILDLAESRGVVHGVDPSRFDPDYVARHLPKFQALYGPGRWFDQHVQGAEHIPEGPALLVSNHSGGTVVLDALGLGAWWYGALGADRPLHGLAHEVVFATRTTGRFLERCGGLRAGHDVARKALLDMGRQVVVMPGGDRDVWRPASRRYRVTFAGRSGYARLAMRLGVPVVPVAHVGAHHTLHVLTDGRRLARKLGIVRPLARAEIFPVHLSLPWGLAVGPWPHLPPPTRFDYRFGEPILPSGDPDDATAVTTFDARVQYAIQDMLHDIRDERQRRRTRLRDVARRTEDAQASLAEFFRLLRDDPDEDFAQAVRA